MDAKLLESVAKAIVDGLVLQAWPFYVSLGVVAFLTSAVGAWVGSYLKRRAEVEASRSDLAEILRQLRATTLAAEEVRTQISRTDWAAREWRTVCRIKLEELLVAVHSIDRWLDEHRRAWIYKESLEVSVDPTERARVFVALYFPELASDAEELFEAKHSLVDLVLSSAPILNDSKADPDAYEKALHAFVVQWREAYSRFAASVGVFEQSSAKLMRSWAVQ